MTQPTPLPAFKTVATEFITESIVLVSINRPKAKNSMNALFFEEFPQVFHAISARKDISVVVLTGNGRIFTAGLDLGFASSIFGKSTKSDSARKAFDLHRMIKQWQGISDSVAECPVPVIASINGPCIGAGIDMITGCDIRYCTKNTFFSIKEVDVGLVADLGTHSRISKITGNEGFVRELAMTGRNFSCDEALQFGLVSKIFNTPEELKEGSIKLAKIIASKSPVAVRGVKRMCNYALDHTVEDCQDYVRVWNGAMLQTNDTGKAAMAFIQKKQPTFSKL